MINVEKIKPTGLFTNYIFKAIPLAFDESMSYYETLCGLLSYLKDTVIPTLNNNADAIIEVQTLMQNLQNYVDNYFDNLDVQEEINNKLDKMVLDGTLSNLINENLLNEINEKVEKNTLNIKELNNSNYKTTGLSMHISFDDCEHCFQNLINNIYDSLFDEPFFNMLKTLHDNYNACFSLYVFTDTFNNIASTRYQNEFINNSNWLKFGYHALNASDNLSNATFQEFKTRYNNFVTNCLRICGTNRIIDRVPRLANYVAPLNCINGGAEASCGIIGLLDADDNRISYLHNSLTKNFIDEQFEYFDNITNLFFIKTNLRIENSSNLDTDLSNILNTTKSTNRNIEIFTHEWYVYDGNTIINKDKIELCCQFAQNNNIPFNFVENKIPNMVGKSFNQNNTLGVIARENSNLYYNNFLPLYRNTTIGSLKRYIKCSSNSALIISDSNKNYGLLGYLIKTSNTLEIHNNLPNIQCAIFEFNSIIGNGNKTENGYGFDRWIDISSTDTTRITLQENTKMIGLVFRTTNEEFTPTDEDILINTYAIFV